LSRRDEKSKELRSVEVPVAPIHRAAEKGSTPKPGFR
jgi:hypothetical protein